MIEDERGVAAGPQKMLFRRDLAEILIAHRVAEGEVAVAFDEARHQREARSVDRLGRLLRGDLAFAPGDLRNPIADDENFAGKAVVRLAVPDLHVAEKSGRHPLILPS